MNQYTSYHCPEHGYGESKSGLCPNCIEDERSRLESLRNDITEIPGNRSQLRVQVRALKSELRRVYRADKRKKVGQR